MEKQTEIMEENLPQTSQSADTAGAEREIAAADLGKFKSVDALLGAYRELEAEFTRRSQRLKELEAGNKVCPDGGAPSQAPSLPSACQADAAGKEISEDMKRAVIEGYLREVSAGKSVPLLVGGVSALAPKNTPKSVKEAGALARQFLK